MLQVRWVTVLLGLAACGDNVRTGPRIAGRVFSDDNRNGVQDPGEAGVAGVEIRATLRDTTEFASGETDVEGFYLVEVPVVGTYDVTQILPFGFRAGQPQQNKRAPIIGGSDATENQYGFMVSVASKFGGGAFPFCGGVLISDRHVITAAHCSQGEAASGTAVIAGTLDPFSDEGSQIFDVEEILLHPEFDGDPSNGFDISLWTLAEPIDLAAANLTTVEMATPATAQLTAAGALATTLGWGVSDRDSALLQQVHVPLISEDDCRAAYPGARAFDTQICAGTEEGGIDSCQGDSGGPLLVRDPVRGVWLHAGITSYGDGCALPGVPGVYGRTSALAAWVMGEATEPGATASLAFGERGQVAVIDFPAFATTRPQVGDIAERWQVTATTLPAQVDPDTAVSVGWSILGESSAMTGFTCTFDPDVTDAVAGDVVACGVGATEHQLAGFPTGIFAAELSVTRSNDDITFQRPVDVFSGNPPATTTSADLTNADAIDPDYGGTFRVDYYDITATTGKAFAIEADSSEFDMFITLYDLAERDFVNGGGILAFGSTVAGKERIVVRPEAGISYLVGVSTLDDNDTGAYTISILNDGTLTPH